MKTKISLILFSFSLLFLFQMEVRGQSNSISQVLDIQLKNSGTIIQNGQISGYYFFYMVDKVDRKTREFVIQVLDENLNEVAKKSIIENKHTVLLEGVFNGEALMFSFYNLKDEMLTLRQYDLKMKEISLYSFEQKRRVLEATSYMGAAASMSGQGDELNIGKTLYPVPGNGFLQILGGGKGNKYWFIMQYISTNDPSSNWQKSFQPKKGYDYQQVLRVTSNFIFTNRSKADNTFGKNARSSIEAYIVPTGDKLWSKAYSGDKKGYKPYNVFYDESKQEVLISGIYYEKISLKATPDGVFMDRININGNDVASTISKWTEMKKFVELKNNGKVVGQGNLHPQYLHKSSDGKYFLIAESYSQKINAGAAALTLLGGGNSPSKFFSNGFVVLEYSNEMALNNVWVLDKPKSSSFLPLGAGTLGSGATAYFAELFGLFDYEFTQSNSSGNIHSIVYTGRDEEKKSDYIVGSFTYNDGKYTEDRIKINKKADAVRYLPGKPGFLLFMEYFRKEKKMNMKLSKINY